MQNTQNQIKRPVCTLLSGSKTVTKTRTGTQSRGRLGRNKLCVLLRPKQDVLGDDKIGM